MGLAETSILEWKFTRGSKRLPLYIGVIRRVRNNLNGFWALYKGSNDQTI